MQIKTSIILKNVACIQLINAMLIYLFVQIYIPQTEILILLRYIFLKTNNKLKNIFMILFYEIVYTFLSALTIF